MTDDDRPTPDPRDQAWDVVADVRDAYPRRCDDASTLVILDALVSAGLLATAPTTTEWRRAFRTSEGLFVDLNSAFNAATT